VREDIEKGKRRGTKRRQGESFGEEEAWGGKKDMRDPTRPPSFSSKLERIRWDFDQTLLIYFVLVQYRY
jgi:hypothetical protein